MVDGAGSPPKHLTSECTPLVPATPGSFVADLSAESVTDLRVRVHPQRMPTLTNGSVMRFTRPRRGPCGAQPGRSWGVIRDDEDGRAIPTRRGVRTAGIPMTSANGNARPPVSTFTLSVGDGTMGPGTMGSARGRDRPARRTIRSDRCPGRAEAIRCLAGHTFRVLDHQRPQRASVVVLCCRGWWSPGPGRSCACLQQFAAGVTRR